MKFLIRSFTKNIVGIKLFMSSTYVDGVRTPVTVVKVGPCIILDVEKQLVRALLIKFKFKKYSFNKSFAGLLESKNLFNVRNVFNKIFSLQYNLNSEICIQKRFLYSTMFKVGDFIDVSAISKGKGFQGVIKRWGFSKQPKTHGSMSHRRGGSFGNREWPAEIQKGKKMPGVLGCTKNTVQNLTIVSTFHYNSIIFVKGSIPGHSSSIIRITFSKKKY